MKTTVVVCKTSSGAQKADFESALTRIAGVARRRLIIISPYFTYKDIAGIIRKIPDEVSVDIFVSINPRDQTYIDHKLLLRCRSLGCTIFGTKNLHAKIYMADNKKAIVGSANLTYPSVSYRWECGVLVESRNLMKQITGHIESIMKQSKELTVRDIEMLDKIRRKFVKKADDDLERQSDDAQKEWDEYVAEKPVESALILTIDGTQFDRIHKASRRKFAVIKRAFFPAQWQIENIQRAGERLSNPIPILFYVRKWTDEKSEGGMLVATGDIPPYGYYRGGLRSLKVLKSRRFGSIPMFTIEPGQEDLNMLPRKKRQSRVLLVIKDYTELKTRIDTADIEKVLDSLKEEYEWIGEGMVMGPAGRYIPIEAYESLMSMARTKRSGCS